ncbi:MAG: hypothetical protein KAU50_07310, partial [Candidatus Marinimicrobia bacterium]|nr:hypothetical protein [Candidatus Neomarinimicrobiota bacterium]
LAPFFGPASRRLIEWVGATAYTDADLATPTDQDRADALKDAEAYLVLYYAAPRLNMVMNDSGIVTYKTVGSTTETFTYLNPSELEELRQVWLRDAVNACRKHITKTGSIVGLSPTADE